MDCSKVALLLALGAVYLVGVASADYMTGIPLHKTAAFMSGHPLHKKRPPTYVDPPHYKPLALSVQGVVFCQNCLYVGLNTLLEAKPLKGARVQLACRDRRYKTFLYDTARTDENGYFLITMPNFDFRRHDAQRTCRVFLLNSYSPTCSKRTNINSGRFGAVLHKEAAYPDRILFSTGPFAFAPNARCKPTPAPYSASPAPTYSSSPPPVAYAPPPVAYDATAPLPA